MSDFESLNNKSKEKYNAQKNEDTKVETVPYNLGGKIRTYAILGTKNLTVPKTNMDMYLVSNTAKTKDLANTLKPGRFCYIKMKGKYREEENSVMIINITLDFTLHLAETYEQESFFWADESGISYYEMNKDTHRYELIEKTGRIDDMQDADNFFSKYYDFKFDIYFKYLHQAVGEAYDEERLVKSVTEGISEKSRYFSRCGVYKKSYEDILRDLQDTEDKAL